MFSINHMLKISSSSLRVRFGHIARSNLSSFTSTLPDVFQNNVATSSSSIYDDELNAFNDEMDELFNLDNTKFPDMETVPNTSVNRQANQTQTPSYNSQQSFIQPTSNQNKERLSLSNSASQWEDSHQYLLDQQMELQHSHEPNSRLTLSDDPLITEWKHNNPSVDNNDTNNSNRQNRQHTEKFDRLSYDPRVPHTIESIPHHHHNNPQENHHLQENYIQQPQQSINNPQENYQLQEDYMQQQQQSQMRPQQCNQNYSVTYTTNKADPGPHLANSPNKHTVHTPPHHNHHIHYHYTYHYHYYHECPHCSAHSDLLGKGPSYTHTERK